MKEVAKTLYEHGANSVIAVVLAVHQLTQSILQFHSLECRYCNSKMKLRMKQSDQTLSFGCENDQAHSNKSYTINLEKGISMLKT